MKDKLLSNCHQSLVPFALRVLMDLEATHSFVKTAKNLSLSQSAISRVIIDLENNLHVTMVDRSHRPIQLTYEARELIQHFQPCLDNLPTVLDAIQNKNNLKPHLRIGLVETFSLNIAPSLLQEVRSDVSSCLCLTGTSDRLIRHFQQNELDIILSSDQGMQLSNVRRNILYGEPTLLVMPKGYARKHHWTWGQLKLCGLPFADLNPESGGARLLSGFLSAQDLRFVTFYQIDSIGIVIHLIQKGACWSLIRPAALIKYRGLLDKLDIVPMPEPYLSREVYALARNSFPIELYRKIVGSASRLCREEFTNPSLQLFPWLKGFFLTTDETFSRKIAL